MVRIVPRPLAVGGLAVAWLAALGTPSPAQVESTANAPYFNFESDPVRALALSPTGNRLFALNTPDHRLEVWNTPTGGSGFVYQGSVMTGLEPVSMVLDPTDASRMFVANLVSDSVAVIDVNDRRVLATFPVGDEPQDLAITNGRLYVACARARSDPSDPASAYTEHAVAVFDATAPYAHVATVGVEAHKPRSLAVEGNSVWVIPLNSGNRTTILEEDETKVWADEVLGLLAHPVFAHETATPTNLVSPLNPALLSAWLYPDVNNPTPSFRLGDTPWFLPWTGRVVTDVERNAIVDQIAQAVTDDFSSPYVDGVPQPLTLPDSDIVPLLTSSLTIDTPRIVSDVGTTLYALERHPTTNDLWVACTDADNTTRFEPVLRGQAVESRVTLADASTGQVISHVDLNSVDSPVYAQPIAIAFAQSYGLVACMGSSNIAVLDSTGAFHARFDVGQGPTSLLVDDAADRLYVFCRVDKTVELYDLTNLSSGSVTLLETTELQYDPEPKIIADGRRLLYASDGAPGGNATQSCATCHPFGHMDMLAWDLGDPEGGLGYAFPDLHHGILAAPNQPGDYPTQLGSAGLHPMKGPMVTQSLRGLVDSRPFHWRGDRRFFQNFRGAFDSLLGGNGVTHAEMQEYTSFVDSLVFPPNPYQPADRVYTGDLATGRIEYGFDGLQEPYAFNETFQANVFCIECHKADFSLAGGDFSGSQTTTNFDAHPQFLNTPQLRGVYEKQFKSLLGFGTDHEGGREDTLDFLETFFSVVPVGTQTPVDTFPYPFAADSNATRQRVADFVNAWDSGLSPRIGSAFHLPNLAGVPPSEAQALIADANAFLNIAEAEASLTDAPIDLIARGAIDAAPWVQPRGAVYTQVDGQWAWLIDEVYDPTDVDPYQGVSRNDVLSVSSLGFGSLTFFVVPPGTGRRLGVDRDEDGLPNWWEISRSLKPWDPDTDGDSHSDRLEVDDQNGSTSYALNDQLEPNDTVNPSVANHEPRAVFHTTATVHMVMSEPSTAIVNVYDGATLVGTFSEASRRVRHDIVLSALPPGRDLEYRISGYDGAGNAIVPPAVGNLTTVVQHLHVDALSLAANAVGGGALELTVTVDVVDQDGTPVAGAPMTLIWAGDNALPALTTDETVMGVTNASGRLTYTTPSFVPANPGALASVSPWFLGSEDPSSAFFVGESGDPNRAVPPIPPSFFYEQAANSVNYATTVLQ